MDPTQETPANLPGIGPQPTPQQPQPDPLGEAVKPPMVDPLSQMVPAAQTAKMPDDVIKRRSSMYSFGALFEDHGDSFTYEDLMDAYTQQADTMESAIKMVGDIQLRSDAQMRATARTVNNLANIETTIPEAASYAREALMGTLKREAAEEQSMAAEREWAENLSILQSEGRDDVADLTILDKELPTLFDEQVRTMSTRAMIMKQVEEAQSDINNRSFLWSLVDMGMMFVPFANSMSQTDNFATDKKNWWDDILPGHRMSSENSALWSAMKMARSDTQRNDIAKQYVAGVDKNTQFLFGQNLLMKQALLGQLNGYVDQGVINAFAAVDNFPFMFAVGAKAFRIPFKITGTLKAFNLNKEAADLVTKGMAVLRKDGEQALGKSLKMTVEEIEANALNDSVNVHTARPAGLKTAAEAAKHLEDLEKSLHLEQSRLLVKMQSAPDAATEARLAQIQIDMKGLAEARKNPLRLVVDPVPEEVNNIIADAVEDLRKLTGDLSHTQRLNDVERAKMEADMIERAKRLGQTPKKNARSGAKAQFNVAWGKLVEEKLPTTGQSVYMFESLLGRRFKKGENFWFKEKKGAERAAKNLGVEWSVEEQPGGWGIKIRTAVDEGGSTLSGKPIYDPMGDKLTGGAWSWLMQHAGGKLAMSEELHGLAGMSESKRNLIMSKFNNELLPKFFAISDKERFVLRHTLSEGERISTWFTDHELETLHKIAHQGEARDPSKFVEAYHAAHRIGDMDYTLRNMEEYVNLSTQGYQTVSFGQVKGVVGKVLRNTKTIPKEAIFQMGDDVGQGIIYTDEVGEKAKITKGKAFSRPRMNLEQLQDLQRNGYTLVRTHKPQQVMIGMERAQVSYFLVKNADIELGPLTNHIIPYKAGGHRMYKGKYFVKYPVRVQQPWGQWALTNPFTPTVAVDRASAEAWVKEANAIKATYREGKKNGMADDVLEQLIQDQIDDSSMSFPGARATDDEGKAVGMIDWFEKYGVDEEFEVVFDREQHSAYTRSGITSIAEEDVSGISTYLDSQGQMYRSPKGEILRNINDWNMPAETVDPFKIINRSLTNVARLTSFTDFKLRAVNKWIATYQHALDIRNMEDLNPMRIFLDGQFDKRTKEGQLLAAQAEIQRGHIKRVLGWKSDADLGAEASGRRLAEWVAGDKAGKWSRLVHDSQNWWVETRPVNALMGMAFDSTMGFWNPGQFPLQIQTSIAAVTIDPARGGTAMANMLGVGMYMRKAGNEKDLEQMVKWGWHKTAGFEDPESYKMMMRELKRSGWMNNMAAVLKNEYGPNAALGRIGRGVQEVRNNGRIFVDKAEEWNRAVAWQIAWRQIDELPKYKGLVRGTPAHNEKVASLARTYAFNMDEAGAAWWQKNTLTKLPTQFMGYMVRWHEMLWNPDFEKVFKSATPRGLLSPNLKSEKIRFIMGQGLMYGAAGLPFVAGFAQAQETATGKVADINTVEGAITRGLFDVAINALSGADVRFSDRAGIGAYPTEIVREMFGMSQYGDVAAADIALGATYQITKDAAGAVGRLMGYAVAESGSDMGRPLTEHAVMSVARHISTLNNIMKMQAILEYGKYTNRYGQKIGQNVPDQYAFAALLGLNPESMHKLTAELNWLENRKDSVKEWSKQVLIYREQVANAIARGDYAEADKIGEGVNFLMKVIVPQELRAQVKAEANKGKQMDSIVDSVARRIQEEQARDEMVSN